MVSQILGKKRLSPLMPEGGQWMIDPLDECGEFETMTIDRRQLVRIALVASETGARFQRDGLQQDPMAWILSPRRMFDGRAPIEACMARDNCAKAVLLHGLGLDLNLPPEAIDTLMHDMNDEFACSSTA